MDAWIFNGDEFQDWLRRRRLHADSGQSGRNSTACTACGSAQGDSTYFYGSMCGYCLAYEFGVDSQERRICSVITGLVRVFSDDHPDRNQAIFRQLISDAEARLAS